MARKYTDYIYKNQNDTIRFKIAKEETGWFVDKFVKKINGFERISINNEIADVFEYKRDAIKYIVENHGKIKSIIVENVTDGWS